MLKKIIAEKGKIYCSHRLTQECIIIESKDYPKLGEIIHATGYDLTKADDSETIQGYLVKDLKIMIPESIIPYERNGSLYL